MFNYNHLFYFYTTARLNGVTNASKVLKVAQPSLSIQLKTLEASIGHALFEKVGRRLHLTATGKIVFELCRNIFEAAEELEDFLKHSAGNEIKRVRIGVSPEIERPFVADVLSSLLHDNIKTRPHLAMMTSEHKELVGQLLASEIDVVVTNHMINSQNIITLAELSMPVIAVASSGVAKELNAQVKIPFVKILKKHSSDLVLPSEVLKLRLETDLFLQKHKVRNPVVFESDILSVIVRAVLEGVGVGFLPELYIKKELFQKNLVVLNEGKALWESKLYVFVRKKKVMDPIISQIKNHFLSLGGKQLKSIRF